MMMTDLPIRNAIYRALDDVPSLLITFEQRRALIEAIAVRLETVLAETA